VPAQRGGTVTLACGGSDRHLKRDDPQSRLSGQMRSGIECRVYSRGQLCCVSTATDETGGTCGQECGEEEGEAEGGQIAPSGRLN
jgi:hypothetical protein